MYDCLKVTLRISNAKYIRTKYIQSKTVFVLSFSAIIFLFIVVWTRQLSKIRNFSNFLDYYEWSLICVLNNFCEFFSIWQTENDYISLF